jgi:hypothetical protein
MARWIAMSLVLLGRVAGLACQRDESLPATWPLAAGTGGPAFSNAPLELDAVAAQPLIRAAPAAVAPLVAGPASTFVRHDLSSSPFGQVTQGINVGDIDGDGRPDLVVGGDEYLLWYRNPDWTPNLIANGFKFAGGAMVVVRDMDGDGRLDVLTGRYVISSPNDRQMVWYGNTPAGWAAHVMSTTSYCHDLAFADFDRDGRVDTACDDHKLKQVSWLKAPANPTALWTTKVIDARNVMGADVADIDRDGAVDVVAGRAWYRNDGAGRFVRYAFTTLVDAADRFFDDYAKVNVLDLDGDGRLDVFATLFANSREGQVWAFFAPADPRTQPWTGVQIDPGPLFGVHSQAVARFDGTSRPQVMVAETNIGGYGFGPNPDPQTYVYRLAGAARTPAGWERLLVDDVGTHEARAVDLDGDGFPDIAGGEENTDLVTPPRDGQVSWWENLAGGAATTTSIATGTTAQPTTTTPTTTLPGGSQQRTLQPDSTSGVDNQITGTRNATSNYGAGTSLCVGNDAMNSERALVRFDLSSLGTAASVTSCVLTFTVRQVTAPTAGRIVRLRRGDWSETGSTWNAYKSGAPWGASGAASATADVDATTAVSFTPPAGIGAYTFPSLVTLCQDAVTNRAGALDLLIRQDVDQDGACSGSCAAHEFCSYSSDFTTAASRPRLVVTYATGATTSTSSSTTSTSIRPSTSTAPTPSTSTTTTTGGPSTTLRLTLQPDAAAGVDNQMAGGRNTTANYGTVSLCVGNDQANSERVLIRFDLSALGSRASVKSCLLTFTVYQVTAPTAGRIVRLRRPDWSETTSTWAAYKTGAAWSAPGAGDETTDVDATLAVPFTPPAATGAFTLPSLQALCQDAVQNRAGILDLVVAQTADQNGACAGTCVPHEFCSRSSDYSTAANRPRLVVGYAP